jgi:hypothetical protein
VTGYDYHEATHNPQRAVSRRGGGGGGGSGGGGHRRRCIRPSSALGRRWLQRPSPRRGPCRPLFSLLGWPIKACARSLSDGPKTRPKTWPKTWLQDEHIWTDMAHTHTYTHIHTLHRSADATLTTSKATPAPRQTHTQSLSFPLSQPPTSLQPLHSDTITQP